ncbi:hypothetical protein F4808DRAFT_370485 [Astrocystis sublimbata]|nr:hypothetical protein F4808DRAFT_370485 [Astrocystis sublimbata]
MHIGCMLVQARVGLFWLEPLAGGGCAATRLDERNPRVDLGCPCRPVASGCSDTGDTHTRARKGGDPPFERRSTEPAHLTWLGLTCRMSIPLDCIRYDDAGETSMIRRLDACGAKPTCIAVAGVVSQVRTVIVMISRRRFICLAGCLV